MSNPPSASRRNRSKRRRSPYRRLHRWLGLASFAFVFVFSATGVALNHSPSFGLDEHYVSAPWLLDWYGISAPAAAASFAAGGARMTLLGDRLYLDDREVARGIDELRGAVRLEDFYIAAASDSLLFATPSAELADRIDLRASLPRGIDAVGVASGRVVLRSRGDALVLDARTLELTPLDVARAEIDWSRPSAAEDELLDALSVQYRGRGVTLERLLYDIHSGRILGATGTLLADLVAALLVILAATGFYLWFRRRD